MKRVVLIVAAFYSGITMVSGQNSGVSGRIFDSHGAVVHGIRVTAKNKDKESIDIRADKEGKFLLSLAVGTYSIEVGDEYTLFCPVRIEGYRVVDTKAPMMLDIVLTESISSHDTKKCKTKVIKY